MKKKELKDLVVTIQKLIEEYGSSEVVSKLYELHLNNASVEKKELFHYTVTMCCNYFNCKKNDVLYSKKRGVITNARRMCFALLKEFMPITDEEIANHFGGRSRQLISREIQNLPLSELKLTTKDEIKFVDDYYKLAKDLNIYINNKGYKNIIK